MQSLWYPVLRLYVRVGLLYYFKKIEFIGKENIPSGPIIFAANHQNAFLDALLIVCFVDRSVYFLTRADIFKKGFVRKILSALKMIPVYRIRDGWQSLTENQKTFDECSQLFKRNETVVIFPEGNHGGQRRLRPLSKGFARIAFSAIEKKPDLKISIVPVGINYSDHQAFRSSVSIHFGRPLVANEYFLDQPQVETNRLKTDLAHELRQLITHVDDTQRYDEIIRKLELAHADYLRPISINSLIARIEKNEDVPVISSQQHTVDYFFLFKFFSQIINFIPLSIWYRIKKGIEDPVFVASLKFGIGIFLFPFFYLLIALILMLSFAWPVSAVWLLISFPSMFFRK